MHAYISPALALASTSSSEPNNSWLLFQSILFHFIWCRPTQVSTSQTSIFVSVAIKKLKQAGAHCDSANDLYICIYAIWNAQHSKHTSYLFRLILFKGMGRKTQKRRKENHRNIRSNDSYGQANERTKMPSNMELYRNRVIVSGLCFLHTFFATLTSNNLNVKCYVFWFNAISFQ